jgi:hypothetical protein
VNSPGELHLELTLSGWAIEADEMFEDIYKDFNEEHWTNVQFE